MDTLSCLVQLARACEGKPSQELRVAVDLPGVDFGELMFWEAIVGFQSSGMAPPLWAVLRQARVASEEGI